MINESSILQERIEQLAERQESRETLKCFGEACRGCKDFFACPAHWGESDE